MIDKKKVSIPERFSQHPIFNEQHCGVNFGFMAKRGYYSRPEVLAEPEKMAKVGVNWCTLNANLCQEAYHSTKVFLDFHFSSGENELSEIARRLHDNGIHILLKPCLTPLDGAWMGNVSFPVGYQIQGTHVDYWSRWFASFTDGMKYFAEFAERNRIEGLIAGAEYFGTEGRSEEWRKVISDVRSIYSGPVTYEFVCDSCKAYKLPWFDALDFLSLSYYPPAREKSIPFKEAPDISTAQMVDYLQSCKTNISGISERFGNKPIVFTEIGTRSAHGCIAVPSDYLTETYYDGEEQAHYMEAVFRTFSDLPQWMGLYWWKWDETQNRPHYHDDPKGDKGFTFFGKPAEEVLRKWFSRKQ